MFDLIAKTLLRKTDATTSATGADSLPGIERAEVETLFRADMDRFTRIAMDRRARKARMSANAPVLMAA